MGKHTFYAGNDINAGGKAVKEGEVVAILDVPGDLPLDAVVRAIANGLATQNKPTAPKGADPSPAK